MKKSLLLIVFVTALFTSKAQSWAPVIGTYWYQTYNPSPTWCSEGYAKFDYFKDSLIAGNNCQAIRRYHFASCQSGNTMGYGLYFYTYTNNKVVYINDYLSTTNVQTQTFDTLFYFNAPIGYKWQVSPTSYTGCTGPKAAVTVADTGHTLIQGVNLKWQKVSINSWNGALSSLINDTIYERFGYLKTDIFNPHNFCTNSPDAESYAAFRCYGDNQLINFKYKGLAYNCDYILGIKETEFQKSKIQVYPNPTNSILHIIDDKLDLSNSTILISNTLGQVILSIPYTNQIDISSLANGMYYLILSNNYNKKIVKIIKE